MDLETPTPDARHGRTVDRRTLLVAGAWAAPVIAVAAAVPAASASVASPQLVGEGMVIRADGLSGNVFATFESGTWEPTNLVQITVSSSEGILATLAGSNLAGWVIIAQSAESLTLQYPSAPASQYWTSPYFFLEFSTNAGPGTITVDGLITGTTANGFSGGPRTGPAAE